MQIQAKLLFEFLERIKLNGKIGSAILKTTGQGMEASVINSEQTTMVESILDKSAFVEYKEGLEIPIGCTAKTSNLELLSKALAGFANVIKLEVQKNVLVVCDEQRIVTINLVDKDFVENNHEKKLGLEFDKGFVLKNALQGKTISNISMLDAMSVVINIEKGKLKITTEGDTGSIEDRESIKYKDTRVKLGGEIFTNVFKAVKGDVFFSIISEGHPVLVRENRETIKTRIIIAPKTFEEEMERKEPEKEKIGGNEEKKEET